ncbi:MAG TPA: ABC transporter ATP-binding protein [Tepidisphaeraceae bacterium]|nr:ABC transporter ATP-binding protein [Tepidisphaeraceae bacterium]
MAPTDPTSATLLGLLWSNRRRFAPGLGFAFARIVSIAPLPLIFKRIIDHDMPRRDLRGILVMSGLTVVLLVLHQWLSVRGGKRLGQAVTQMILGLRARTFDKIQYLSFTYLDRRKTGELLAKYAFDTQKVEAVAMPVLNSFLPDTLRSILTLAVLLAINWQLSVIVLLTLPAVAVMRWYYFEPLRRKNEANRVAQEAVTGTATEYLGALRLVRSYGREERARAQLDRTNQEVARSRVELIGVSTSFAAFSFGMIQFLSLVVIAGGAALSIRGHVTPGTVLAFYAGLAPLVQPIQMFSTIADQYFLGQEAYQSIRELLNEPATEQWRGTRRPDPIRGRIEFDHVTFRYPDAEQDALCDFTLTVEPGERVALVGSSGAGKSTAASLLLGLYHASGGEIRIDGIPQSEIDMRWLRRRTALVMQESVLLSGTIEENVRFGRDEATDEQVRQAVRQANAEEFLAALPEGMQTVVGERGVMLSGGQRQRISIARALLRDPAILVLDEPTSALDYESERLIQDALDVLAKGRTVVTIAHRLSTIRNADRVVVLDQGRIVEEGTFAQLWERKGYFQRMLAAQGSDSYGAGAGAEREVALNSA